MSEYKLFKVDQGRVSFAKVSVRSTKRNGGQHVVHAIDAKNEGEIERQLPVRWILAASEGAAEAVAFAQHSQRITDSFLVEITGITGLVVDTTEDAIKCAAAIATWLSLFPTVSDEIQPQRDETSKKWFVRYPVVAKPEP